MPDLRHEIFSQLIFRNDQRGEICSTSILVNERVAFMVTIRKCLQDAVYLLRF